MARRYRYSFVKKKEAGKGKLSVGLAAASLLLFLASVLLAFFLPEKQRFMIGAVCLLAGLLSFYGFCMGLASFSEENRQHRTSIVGSIGNGMILVGWIGLYLMGIR